MLFAPVMTALFASACYALIEYLVIMKQPSIYGAAGAFCFVFFIVAALSFI